MTLLLIALCFWGILLVLFWIDFRRQKTIIDNLEATRSRNLEFNQQRSRISLVLMRPIRRHQILERQNRRLQKLEFRIRKRQADSEASDSEDKPKIPLN